MAACPPPFQADDQTDEDFFDKLVVDDDVSGITGSHSESSTMARAFSNLSIGDEDAGFAAEGDDQEENKTLQSFDAPKNEVSSDSFDFKEGGESLGPEEKKTDLGLTEVSSLGSSMGGGGGSKGTGVKVVQWSSFNVDSQQFDLVGFGSDSDFLTENLDGSASKMNWDDGSKYVFPENPTASSEQQNKQYYGLANEQITNVNDYQYWENPIASCEQQDAHFYGSTNEQTTDMNDSQYWEKVYPGWKYDLSTGQWYQTDGFDSNTNAQSENYNVASENMQESYEDKIQAAGDGVVLDQRSEISYLQQTTKSVVGTVADISNYSQVSQGSTEYPPNMVFNPQYPEWYYDTNTQQWYSLKSYYQTVQTTAGAVQDQPSQVNAWDGFISKENSDIYNEDGHSEQNTIQGFSENQDTGRDRDGSASNYVQHNTWQPDPSVKSVMAFAGNQQIGSFYSSMGHAVNYTDQQIGFKAFEPVQSIGYDSSKGATRFQSFVPSESVQQFSQPKGEQSLQEHLSHSYFANQSSVGYSQKQFQGTNASNSQFTYTNEGRSSAGRPPHALVTFGFGGKLIVMKDGSSLGTKLDYGSQDTVGGAVSIFSLMEVLMDKTDALSSMNGDCSYFHALCQQSFPGPLVGGNAAAKDVNKWIDEMITHCESSVIDVRKGEQLRLLHSLLKISCQHYGKLRSTFAADPSVEETDGPESAVTKLFASARTNSARQREYGSSTHCMQNLPPEGQIRTTAVEVQNLLVSGRRKEALHCAQAGQLWGPALVLAAQLGEKFYVDTVKQMAQRQFVFGSPLRTLCLLIAGQPADVFSANSSANNSLSGAVTAPQQPTEIGMLDDWEENLAIITANRTKDDELVMVHLGDCLWKERGEITAAHTCYLVAEANFESYSDSARLCLIGADHWKCPRTYASPEAIQRTELHEYSKVLGNSQFILLQFQPYKLVYAYMLTEVGKISDSLRYCQASLKLLKNSGRAPEVEMWKSLLSSLEERLRTHQQGGYSTNLAPAKLVGKLFTSIDRSIHRMMGAPTSPLPPVPQRSVNGKESYSVPLKVANSQSTMAMSSLVPSASVEGMSDWTGDRTRKSMHSRSISEPDFGRSPKQDSSKDASSADAQGKVSPSRFGRIGSHLLQKTMGWVSRSGHQAKLGESNKFYYDEKLKRWVEEGAEPPAEEADLPPPPTASSFQNGTPGYNINSAFKSPGFTANGALEAKFPIPQEHSSGIPPISPNPNQFSARGRMGVRSRYVDTFNKGGGGTPLANSFQSPSAPSVKPGVGAKFFVPTTPAVSEKQTVDVTAGESNHEAAANGEPSTSAFSEAEASFYSPSPPPPPPPAMQRFPSMENIPPFGNMGTTAALQNGNRSHSSHSRAASWCGSYGEMHSHKMAEVEPLGDGLGAPSSFMPSKPSTLIPSSSPLQPNGGSWGDDLHEVAL